MRARMLAVAAAAFLSASMANAQTMIPESVVAAGGSRSSGSTYAVRGTLGQPVTGTVAGTSFGVSQGYWSNPYAIVSGADDRPTGPGVFALEQNYPNPFNPTTTIAFSLPDAAWVRLRLYDVNGREVMRVVDRSMPGGRHQVTLDADRLASGVYFYRVEAAGFRQTRKLVLLK